jgi:histidinol dehydrogenase
VPSFQKRISVAEISQKGIRMASKNAALFARAEKFEHHALSIEARLTEKK